MAESHVPEGDAAAIAVENPATGETLATVPDLGSAEVGALAEAARAAQPGWWEAGFDARAEVLGAARRWLVESAERVVGTICAETGRPADETQFAELSYGLAASISAMRSDVSGVTSLGLRITALPAASAGMQSTSALASG